MTIPATAAALAALHCHVVREWLAPPSDPLDVVRSAVGSPGLVALVGEWGGAPGAVIATDPVVVLDPATDPLDALSLHPRLAAPDPDVIGGGWFGAVSYDGNSSLAYYDHVLRLRPDGWYFEALVSVQRDGLLQARRDECEALLDAGPPWHEWQVGPFGGASAARHLADVEQAIEAIRAGEIYQANVCTRLSGPSAGSTAHLFAEAIAQLRPAFGAYVDSGADVVASLSPELFLRRRGRAVQTSPIKGTAPADGEQRLRASVKDAAENIMIVDLMRNDLGSVSETGSVEVPELLRVQAHTGVWHLVSTITGQLRVDVTDGDLLRATFPPGSVTGAPKRRAVELLRDIEAGPRGFYTGAIGFTSPSWGAEFSVAIRTFEFTPGRVELGVGGGITADSVPMLEWRECLDKAAPLLAAVGAELAADVITGPSDPTAAQLAGGVLETILAVDGRVLRLADHLARLDRSVRELYGTGLPSDLAERVLANAATTSGRTALRVVWRDGVVSVSAASLGAAPNGSDVRTVRRDGGLWRHKWADRTALEAGEATHGTPLYVAADGCVLETSRGNVFLITADGTLVTPPLRDDLLPGVTRRAVLDLARDTGRRHEVRPLEIAELVSGAAFWTSSLSLAVPVRSVDGVPIPQREDVMSELALGLIRGGVPIS